MILKFINPLYNNVHLLAIKEAFISKALDDEGNETDGFILIFNSDNEFEYSIFVHGITLFEMNDIINDLYINGKADLTSNTKAKIEVFPRAFSNFLDDEEIPDDLSDEELEYLSDLYNSLDDSEDNEIDI